MAPTTTNPVDSSDHEESSPLLVKPVGGDEKEAIRGTPPKAAPPMKAPGPLTVGSGYSWTADGLPVGHGSVVGEPMERRLWDSSLCACLGRNDEFCSSDVEVCLLGCFVPCVLHGSNVERLGSAPGTFTSHCLTYYGLYLIGKVLFGWNCVAPWFSYPNRTAIRRKFNLEGSCEALHRLCGCCGNVVENEVMLEQWESSCDLATHVFCHQCALCQEGRELRRRLPHPGFSAQPPLFVLVPPGEQTMGRGA